MTGTIALLQARIGSSRLPGKVLMPVQGKTIIEIMLERLKRSKQLDGIVVVTSTSQENDALVYVVEQCQISCFRGSETDVLDRYYQAAQLYDAEHVVRLTGDCPLIDPEFLDKIIGFYHQSRADYVMLKNFPDGLCSSVFSFNTLESAWKNAKLPSEREHVVPFIWKNSHLFNIQYYICPENLSDERWTIDEAADYILLQELGKALHMSIVDATLKDVLHALEQHPEIRAINRHIVRDEGYIRSLNADRQVRI